MTNREEFCALLYGTFYESISDSAIIRQQHEKIRTWVQSNIPSRLYRYRAVNDHTFDALRKDEIWGSSIFSFNDPFECMPHYDPERAKELLKREMDIGQIAEKYRAYKNGGSVPALQSILSMKNSFNGFFQFSRKTFNLRHSRNLFRYSVKMHCVY